MIKFRTPVAKYAFPFGIHHQSKILCIGSCFTEHIGKKLDYYKFPVQLNPFGIIYNPLSIAESLNFLLEKKQFVKTDLIRHNGLWHSFQHHSRFSGIDVTQTLERINTVIADASKHLLQADILTITLGTSYVFILKKTGKIVANCHKIPANEFIRKRLRTEEIHDTLASLFKTLKSENPELNILLTVSPVRHIKEGLIENQRSKAMLLLACDHLVQDFDFVHYFPAYEIMMDDLRDYRFYEKDMIHPNNLAHDYIWQYFSDVFFVEKTVQLNSRIEKILQALQHKAFQAESEKHQQFLKAQLERIQQMEQNAPFLDFTNEIQNLQSRIL